MENCALCHKTAFFLFKNYTWSILIENVDKLKICKLSKTCINFKNMQHVQKLIRHPYLATHNVKHQ